MAENGSLSSHKVAVDRVDSNTEPESDLSWTLATDESATDIETEDAFEHARYAVVLQELIETSPRGHTIGLFGGYGTGKTWIVKRLRKNLKESDCHIGMVEYDSWRYADDEVRRDFLLHLYNELEANDLYKGEAPQINPDGFKVNVVTTREEPAKFSLTAFFNALKDSAIVGILLILASVLLAAAVGLVIDGFPDGLWFAIFGLITSLSWVGNILRAFLSINRLTIRNVEAAQRPRVEFPEEFLAMFETIVDSRKADRLLIVVDNVDRCSPDVAMRLLSTIKNFLQPADKGVFFLIPCDIVALERHLAALFQSRGLEEEQANTDAKEYLGKFFGSSLSITRFEERELRNLATSDLKSLQFGCELPDEEVDGVAAIAASANRQSPRELKVFLNKVSSHALLMKQSTIPSDITLTPSDLAKLHAIQEKAPILWAAIQEEPSALRDAESLVSQVNQQDEDDATLNWIGSVSERRVINALLWHRVEDARVRVFLGLRLPPEADGIPRYFEFLTALEDANVVAGVSIAQEADEALLPRLLETATREVHATAQRRPERSINPALVGFQMLNDFELAQLQTSRFLGSLPPAILPDLVRRSGPIVAANVSAKVKQAKLVSAIRQELIGMLGSTDYSDQELVVKAIVVVANDFTPGELAALQSRTGEALNKDLTFEKLLREVPMGIRSKVFDNKSRNLLIDNYEVPSEPDEQAHTDEALEILNAHASLFSGVDVIRLAKRAEPYLVKRVEAELTFGEIDLQVITEILKFAQRANAAPVDVFGPVFERRLSEDPNETYIALGGKAGDIEPLLDGNSRRQMVNLVVRLVEGEGSAAQIDRDEAIDIAKNSSSRFTNTSRKEIVEALAPSLISNNSLDHLDIVVHHSRSLEDWTRLNDVAVSRTKSDPSQFDWIYEQLIGKLNEKEMPVVFRGTVEGLIALLETEGTHPQSATNLRNLSPYWSLEEAEAIIVANIPFLQSGNTAQQEWTLTLMGEAVSTHNAPNSHQAVAAVTDAIAGDFLPQPVVGRAFDFLAGAVANSSVQSSIADFVGEGLENNMSDATPFFSLGRKLVEANASLHSDRLLPPTVRYALNVENEDWRQAAQSFLGLLEPSTEAITRNRDGLAQLRAKNILPEKFVEVL